MNTLLHSIDSQRPDESILQQAVTLLLQGRLVAFPTETVYGLGAHALDADAVQRIFEAKGRPSTNPIIVHVAEISQAQELTTDWPESAKKLAAHDWPGPLTLVLPRREIVPDIVTAGGPTVAVRIPSHPVALALLKAAGIPIAAPSANRSEQLSPTTAQHVLDSLDGRIDMILDGGPTQVGLESTVLNLATSPPQLLRPGGITPQQIEAIIGPIQRHRESSDEILPSPGLLRRHYAPRTPLRLSQHPIEDIHRLLQQGLKVGWLSLNDSTVESDSVETILMPAEPELYANRLYSVLHEMDQKDLDILIVSSLPETEDWLAIRDRLQRASANP